MATCSPFQRRIPFNNMRRVFTHLRGEARPSRGCAAKCAGNGAALCRELPRRRIRGLASQRAQRQLLRHFSERRPQSPTILMDDCLRCHGMHYEGGIRDLVTPLSTAGPWQLKRAELKAAPVIPCLTCHQIHRQGVAHGKGRAGTSRSSGQSRKSIARRFPCSIAANWNTFRSRVAAASENARWHARSKDQPGPAPGLVTVPRATSTLQVRSGDNHTHWRP